MGREARWWLFSVQGQACGAKSHTVDDVDLQSNQATNLGQKIAGEEIGHGLR
jgi:hypothetical protein